MLDRRQSFHRQRSLTPSFCRIALAVALCYSITHHSHPNNFVEACGVTIHSEVAFRASQLVMNHPPTRKVLVPDSSWAYLESTKDKVMQQQDQQQQPQQQPQQQRYSGHPHRPHHHSSESSSSSSVMQDGNEEESSTTTTSAAAPPTNHTIRVPSNLALYSTLLDQRPLLLAGSFFPDWGYDCIGKMWSQQAEEAHWPGFTEAAVDYLLETYSNPSSGTTTRGERWTDPAAKDLIVFLFGIVSHSVADLSWHSLRGIDEGFIRVLADISFGGDYSKAHTLADIGAEFVLSHMTKDMGHHSGNWKVPVKDLVEIYKRMDYKVPGAVMTHCMRNGFAAAQANSRLGTKLFPVYASQSPFLIEQLEAYPMGGLRDMSAWTVDCWEGLASYLEQDPLRTPNPFHLCDLFMPQEPDDEDDATTGRKHQKNNNKNGPYQNRYSYKNNDRWQLNEHHHHHRMHAKPTTVQGRPAMSVLNDLGWKVLTIEDEVTGSVLFSVQEISKDVNEKDSHQHLPSPSLPRQVLFEDGGRLHFEKVGQQGSKWNLEQDGDGQISFSVPDLKKTVGPLLPPLLTTPNLKGSSLVDDVQDICRLITGGKGNNGENGEGGGNGEDGEEDDTKDHHSWTLFLPVPYASFGHAFVAGDFFGDGQLHLAIGAPYFTENGLVPSQGAVYIVPGQALVDFKETKKIDQDQQMDVRAIASQIYYGSEQEPQSRFGYSMAIVDLNRDGIDDLAIGAPGEGTFSMDYSGTVYVYFGHLKTGLSKSPDLVIRHDSKEDLELKKQISMASIGTSLYGLDLLGTGYRDLIISGPTASVRFPNNVHVKTEEEKEEAERIIKGDDDDDDDDESEDEEPPKEKDGRQVGKAYIFLAKSNHRGNETTIKSDLILQGDTAFGWFGASVTLVVQQTSYLESRSVLVIGSPSYSSQPEQQDDDDKDSFVEGTPSTPMMGRLEGFELSNGVSYGKPIQAKKIYEIRGDSKFQQLGSHLETHIFERVPEKDHTLNLNSDDDEESAAFKNNNNNNNNPHGFPDANELLVVGSQSEETIKFVGRQWQTGVVRILDLSALNETVVHYMSQLDKDSTPIAPPSSSISDAFESSKKPKKPVLASLHGSQAMAHLSAAMSVSPKGNPEPGVWLTEPYSHSESGRILKWAPKVLLPHPQKGLRNQGEGDDGGDDDDGDDDDDDVDGQPIVECFIGSESRGRLGSQVMAVDLDGDNNDDIVVSSAHTSQYATSAGTVTIRFQR